MDTELCSMGGIAECGVNIDQKASPRRAAIEKAQEELRYIDDHLIMSLYMLSVDS